MTRARGVVAAGNRYTAAAAEALLRGGGNAFDAALAALGAACVAEPVLASLGGGGFLLAQPADGAPRVYDFFVHTPRARKPPGELDFHPVIADFGTARQEFHIGRGSAAVPGVVRGLFEVHGDLATVPMRELLAPAIGYARDGVGICGFQEFLLQVVRAIYVATPEGAAVYASPQRAGELIGEGEVLHQPDLADALESIAAEGPDLFYRGEIARSVVADMVSGGLLSGADFEAYRVERRAPLALDYRARRVLTNPPPSSGGILIAFALALLEAADAARAGFGSADHVGTLARVMGCTAEARLAALAERGEGGLVEERLLDPALLRRYRDEIAGRARGARGTTHVSVIDAQGNIASLSVSNGEGCAYVIPGTGVILNNMLGEEDLNPGGFHRWAPDHRMTSMMAPSLVLEADGARIAAGSGGSNRIRSAILQVLVNLMDFHMDVEEAVPAPRVHLEEGLLSIEGGFDRERLAPVLAEYPSHQLWDSLNLFFGGAHTATLRGDALRGAGDPRRAGVAAVV